MKYDATYRIEKSVDTATHEEIGKLRELHASAKPPSAPGRVEGADVTEPWEVGVDATGTQHTAMASGETISEMLVQQGVDQADAEARRLSETGGGGRVKS